MRHEDFRTVGLDEALHALEASLLPSIELLIARAAEARPGTDAATTAGELRALAGQLAELQRLLGAA